MIRLILRWAYRISTVLITFVIVIGTIRLHGSVSAIDEIDTGVVAQLHYLRGALEDGAASDMQALFPEGYFFSYVLYGLSWINVGLTVEQNNELHQQAIEESTWALSHLDTAAGRAPFSSTSDPPYGVFYAGWTSWLRGGILMLQSPSDRDSAMIHRFQADCDAINAALQRNNIPFLEAYPGMSWPVDTVVAVAALRLHDFLFEPRYTSTIETWLIEVQPYLDPQTDLLPHRVDAVNGNILQPARGSSQALLLRFLIEIDPEWGHEQYLIYREYFLTRPPHMPGVREYRQGTVGRGDIDSGPLVGSISVSASVVGVASGRVNNDPTMYVPFIQLGEGLGFPVTTNGEKYYMLGLLPVGDAFVAWASSVQPWVVPLPERTLNAAFSREWRVVFYIVNGLVLTLLWWPMIRTIRKKNDHEDTGD